MNKLRFQYITLIAEKFNKAKKDYDNIKNKSYIDINKTYKYQILYKPFWKILSANKSITIDIIKEYPNLNWNFKELSKHPNITFNQIIENKFNWDINFISLNPNITIKIIKDNFNLKWNYDNLSFNRGISCDDIESNFTIFTNYNFISFNPNITIDFVKKYINKNWNWKALSQNINMTKKIIEQHSNLPWNYKFITYNKNIDFDFILKHPNKNFDKNFIIKNYKITIEQFKKYSSDLSLLLENNYLTFDMYYDIMTDCDSYTIDQIETAIDTISRNETINTIENNTYFDWNWTEISRNKNITIDFIIRNKTKNFNWYYVTQNNNITIQMIIDNSDLPWCYGYALNKPDLTIDFINKYITDDCDLFNLASNTFIY